MEVKYKEWILETIDSLRSRKARPDLERICRMIERRHGLSPAETQQQLQNLVRAELVIKVAYKGSNSYRNAAKWYKNKQRKKQQPSPGSDQESNSKIVKAVVSLLHQQQQQQQQQPQQQQQQPPPPPQQQQQQQHSVCGREDKKGQRGVGIKEIEKYISSQEPKRKVTKARLLLALRREVTRGRLIHSPAGHYSLPQPDREQDERVPASARAASHKDFTEAIIANPRSNGLHDIGYQRSRREKTLEGGPSLRNPPSDAASPASKCVKEQLKDIQECPELGLKKDAHKNESVQCSSSQINCKNKISGSSHPTRSSTFSNCGDLRKSHGMNGQTPGASGHSTDPWLYGECIGNHGEEATKRMLLVRLSSPDQTVRNDKTKEEAVPEQSAAVPDVRGASCLPTPSASPVEMENNENGSLDTKNLENGKPLDPAEWTILDVFNYFKKAGFEEQAIAFQEQEIDGKSLLLMKRSDVLIGLSIKLGPALKIYEYHVKALQMRHLKSGSS